VKWSALPTIRTHADPSSAPMSTSIGASAEPVWPLSRRARGCDRGRQDRRVKPVGFRSVPVGGSGGCIREITSGLAVGCGGWCGVDDLNAGPSEPDSRLSVIYARAMAAYNRGMSARVPSEQHAHAIVFDGACRGRVASRDGALAAAPRHADDRPQSEPRCVDAFRIGAAVLPLPGATAGLDEDRGGALKTGTPSGGDAR
jgi:hypothetical protein